MAYASRGVSGARAHAGIRVQWVGHVRLAQHPPAGRLPLASRRGRLTEANVEAALREIRLALLEADVNFKVVKAFIDRVRDRAMDQEVLRA